MVPSIFLVCFGAAPVLALPLRTVIPPQSGHVHTMCRSTSPSSPDGSRSRWEVEEGEKIRKPSMMVAAYRATDAATRTELGSGLERFGPSGGRELRFLSPPGLRMQSILVWSGSRALTARRCLLSVRVVFHQIVATHVASQTCEV